MADFDPPWAVNGTKRAPTTAEIDGGFPCGPADRALFNFLHHRVQSEINAVITGAGLTPSDADLTQLWTAMQKQLVAKGSSRSRLVFATAGAHSFTVPADVTRIYVQLWGGGGGGGGADSTLSAGSGGGGGGYTSGWLNVTPGTVINFTVGSAGVAGAAGGGNGTAGGTTSFSTLSATGGGGGSGATASTIQTTGGSSGSGSGGSFSLTARGGGFGFYVNNSAGANIATGGFGAPGAFGSSLAGPNVSSAGHLGQFPGGGGSGSSANAAGGNGTTGLVIIDY